MFSSFFKTILAVAFSHLIGSHPAGAAQLRGDESPTELFPTEEEITRDLGGYHHHHAYDCSTGLDTNLKIYYLRLTGLLEPINLQNPFYPLQIGETDDINFALGDTVLTLTSPNDPTESVGANIEGVIKFPSAGTYEFRLRSNDSAFLLINHQLIISNPDIRGPNGLYGNKSTFTVDEHSLCKHIRVSYLQLIGSSGLTLEWKVPSTSFVGFVPVPGTALFGPYW
mmetsp:Transcript_58529/g.174296  ORF Transcript_58529/g.174296 Transcript_58529/m.174296 type:complete len:225 (-) Transcript_58529:195-869(-)